MCDKFLQTNATHTANLRKIYLYFSALTTATNLTTQSTFHNSSSLQLVTLEYDKLNTAIDDLGSSIGSTLDEQKQEIERVHTANLLKVQVSVDELSKEKIQLQDAISSNERACQLETERDWYKKEALHLDETLEKEKAKMKELASKLESSQQEVTWLKGQVEKLTMQKGEITDATAGESTKGDAKVETAQDGSDTAAAE